MNGLNKKEKTNRFQECLSWINSIDIPLCKNCSNVNDLRDGNVFLELLKYYHNYNKKNDNYLSLLNRGNNAENPFERMNIIFHSMSKIINNNRIKSRIETFHNNINGFLCNDNLIMEFLIYIIYLIQKNKNNNRNSKIAKQQNINFNTNKNKRYSCSQIEKKKNLSNYDERNKYKRKIINYNSVKDEKIHLENEKNNFLFYINDKNKNIINIDNLMNFRFTNGINYLKAKNNNLNMTKEIKAYVTKPKIIKYQSQYFNNSKNITNNNKIKNAKSEINFNRKQKYFKNEENKISTEIKVKESEDDIEKMNTYHIYKPANYNPVRNIIEEENKLKQDSEKKNIFKLNDENEIFSYKNDNNLTKNELEEMNVCKLLKLSIDNIKSKDKENLKEEKKGEDQIGFLNQVIEDDKIYNQKRILYSRNNRQTRNKIKQKSGKISLTKNIKSYMNKENKRGASFPIKNKNILKQFNEYNDNFSKKTQKSHSYLHQNHPTKAVENNNITKEEKIYNWLLNLKVIKKEESNIIYLPKLMSDGKLICDIINVCENKDNQIEGISNEISIQENVLMNIKKALEHLNKIEDFPKNNISDYEPIFEIDNNAIWGLLTDLYDYYANKVEIKNKLKVENNEIISSNINNFNFNNEREKLNTKNNKKSSIEMSDLYYNINNIKTKNISHKNAKIKNILFDDAINERNGFKHYNKTHSSTNSKIKYNDSYKNLSIINNIRENIRPNYSSNNNKESDTEHNSLNYSGIKKKNYFYYVNALKHYFDQEKNDINDGLGVRKEKEINSNSEMKNEFFDLNNNNNKLYFNYSNNIFLNNKKSKYSFNPINPDYYDTNNSAIQSKRNNI